MVSKDTGEKTKIKIDRLEVNKETVQDLTDEEADKIKGGNTFTLFYCQTEPSPYNSNGCGQNFSNRIQQTCDPRATNTQPIK